MSIKNEKKNSPCKKHVSRAIINVLSTYDRSFFLGARAWNYHQEQEQ